MTIKIGIDPAADAPNEPPAGLRGEPNRQEHAHSTEGAKRIPVPDGSSRRTPAIGLTPSNLPGKSFVVNAYPAIRVIAAHRPHHDPVVLLVRPRTSSELTPPNKSTAR